MISTVTSPATEVVSPIVASVVEVSGKIASSDDQEWLDSDTWVDDEDW